MNKQAKTNIVLILLIVGLVILAYFLLSSQTTILQKQVPKSMNFSNTGSSPGGTKIELVSSTGERGYMGNDFYKIGSTDEYSIIRGQTAVSCTTTAECKAKPTCVGNSFCQTYISCYDSKCSYTSITAIALHTVAKNSGTAILNVTFANAATTPVSTAFNTAYAGSIGKSVVLDADESYDFVSLDMPLSSYSTGAATTFTSSAHAVNTYTGVRIPTSGEQTSSVTFTIYPDPTSGFTIAISQLGGI